MAATIAAPPGAEADTGAGKKKKLLALVLVFAVAAAAGWWFLFKPVPADGAAKEPKPGVVVPLEPITINLASGHYLKLGLALQQTDKGHEADGSKALDLAIDLFSGRSINDLANRDKREKLKHELIEDIAEAYHHDVYTIYFTEFVWQ